MFKQLKLLEPAQIEELKQISRGAHYVDGKISNPHSKVKNNLQMNDAQAYQRSSQILMNALTANEDFMNFAFPARIAPPLMTRYETGMHYGLHPDSALMQIQNATIRSDLSATIFLNAPGDYEGGALRITLGDSDLRFKGEPGTAIVYPSSTLHEVEKIVSGERLVAITFIQSRIRDMVKRELLYELNEVAALEGLKMSFENFSRLQAVQFNLTRRWSEI